jgi:hypothetical protein
MTVLYTGTGNAGNAGNPVNPVLVINYLERSAAADNSSAAAPHQHSVSFSTFCLHFVSFFVEIRTQGSVSAVKNQALAEASRSGQQSVQCCRTHAEGKQN